MTFHDFSSIPSNRWNDDSDITTEGTLLGKNVSAPIAVTPNILVRVPRAVARDIHGIKVESFTSGNDLWRAYECSTVTKNGMPVYFIANIQYRSDSEYLVESKSLKLYLNSYNLERSNEITAPLTIKTMLARIRNDLENLLKTDVRVWSDYLTGNYLKIDEDTFKGYKNLETLVDYSQINIETDKVNADHLIVSTINENKDVRFSYGGFRSNCKITNAPDYATVFVRLSGHIGIDPAGLAKYLTSYRNSQHLHEECCELMFSDLKKLYNPLQLYVTCCYTRRGGIDITPTRIYDVSEIQHNTAGTLGSISYSYPEHRHMYTPSRTIYQ